MSVTLEPIPKEALQVYLSAAFSGDHDLLTKYHISPGTLEHCAGHTLGLIDGVRDFYKEDMETYVVVLDKEIPIGYTVLIKNETIPNEVYSFGINIEHRSKENLLSWLSEIKKKLGEPYYIVLWSKNTRAIKFFERNGFSVENSRKILGDETKTLLRCQQED
jgi:hypothetical protein